MSRPYSLSAFPDVRPLALALLSACLALPPIVTRAEPMGAQGDDFLYRVEQHDTLEQLARRYTLRTEHWPTLQRLNQVDDPHRLPIGKVLHIPLSLIPEQPATATAVHVTGQVTADGRPVQPGDVLHSGQSLRSIGDGTATLRLEDQSLLTLTPGATLELQRLQSFQGTGLTDTQISIDRGTLESAVAPAGTGVGRFEVRTPATVTGVRGTRLRVHADASGSRHEVLHGHAAIAGSTGTEQSLDSDRGAAYDTSGTLLSTQPLLPPPQGLKMTGSNGQRLEFEPIPKAVAYTVRITLDAEGARLESIQRVAGPGAPLRARSGGPRYVFVRGIDTLGIEGRDAALAVDSLRAGLTAGDGSPILTANGAPVLLD
ncbi:MAG: FecR domain-containing protein [Castellaniella sp.]|uniref:FecR domain-containing protein n=4 Tax=Castellaniella sp. TaxID=1955812 RepID=UPI003C73FB42